MDTLWTVSAPEQVLLRGTTAHQLQEEVAKNGAANGDDDIAAVAASAGDAEGAEEEGEDAVGQLRMRVGRIDAWREQGFSSAREQREQHGSDLHRYNIRRKKGGRPGVTEEEFKQMLERGGDEVSSISGRAVVTPGCQIAYMDRVSA
jgi:hypothetical protein